MLEDMFGVYDIAITQANDCLNQGHKWRFSSRLFRFDMANGSYNQFSPQLGTFVHKATFLLQDFLSR